MNPLPAHTPGSASGNPDLQPQPAPANPPPHTVPPVVPGLGMLPPPTWSHPGVVRARPRAVDMLRRLCAHFGGPTRMEPPRIRSRLTTKGLRLIQASPLLDCGQGTLPAVQQHRPSVCSTLRLANPQVEVTLPFAHRIAPPRRTLSPVPKRQSRRDPSHFLAFCE